MPEASDPQLPSSKPPEDFRWGISYLREDLQDLHQDMNRNNQGLQAQIQELRQDMNRNNQGLQTQIQELRQDTNREVKDIRQDVRALHNRTDETNRRIDSRFAVLLTTMVAMTGLMMAVMKMLIPSP